VSSATTTAASSTSSAIPPQIQINGDNPASNQVRDTYNDLGATITGPAGDLSLGVKVSVDGRATTMPDQIPIDTTQVGTHSFLYSATDQSGLVGYATRTVNVVLPEPVLTSSPSIAPTPDASSTAAPSTTPATNTASGSDGERRGATGKRTPPPQQPPPPPLNNLAQACQ
jgi:Bacterial surface protein, Ig-like domain